MDVWLASCGIGAGLATSACVFVASGTSYEDAGFKSEGIRAFLAGNPLIRGLRRASEREVLRTKALRQLPTMLDVVTLGLSSGLSFDASLELYCTRYDTELSRAFGEAMLSWQIGALGREEALVSLGHDLDVAALRRFADAVCQALAFGSPLAQALEQQAQAIRDEQRAEMEAEIERVPVKMLIPLGTLIVPAMLLSILGPIVGSSMGIG